MCTRPTEIVQLLNTLFCAFDNMTVRHGVYKVEHVASTYVVAANVPDACEDHACRLADLAWDMLKYVRDELPRELCARPVRRRVDGNGGGGVGGRWGQCSSARLAYSCVRVRGKQIHLKIGIHTGEVVAGVVGSRKYSYHLFGDTMNTASRMMSHSEKGRIRLSKACMDAIRHAAERRGLDAAASKYQFEEQTIQVKGTLSLVLAWRGETPQWVLICGRVRCSGGWVRWTE